MIRITVLYPNQPGGRFDQTYYFEKHIPLVKRLLGSYRLVRVEVDKGLGSGRPGSPAPFVWVGHMYFNSLDDFAKGMATHGAEVMADVPNFTDLRPQMQISEIVVS